MELIVKQLIKHDYSLEDLQKNCSPDTLKDTNLEWDEEAHKTHPYATDISNNDIVFSIKWCGREEEYAYFFFKKEVREEVILYTFEKSVIDTNLPEDYLSEMLKSVIELLNNGNYIQKDRLLYGGNNFPLVEYFLESTISSISDNFLLRFQSEREGITPLPQTLLNKENAPE